MKIKAEPILMNRKVIHRDMDGSIIAEITHDENGRRLSHTDALGKKHLTKYNDQGLLIYQKMINGFESHYEWNEQGLQTYCKKTNPEGYYFESWDKYDENGNNIYHKDTETGDEYWVTYNKDGLETSRVFGDGYRSDAIYDNQGNCLSYKTNDGYEEVYEYSPSGLCTYHKSDGVEYDIEYSPITPFTFI